MGLELLLPLIIIALVVMMFVQSSKQRKAMRSLHEMQASLIVGDRVLTTSGLHATIVSAGEETVVLEVAPGVRTQWDRRVIREKLADTLASGEIAGPDATGSRTEPTSE